MKFLQLLCLSRCVHMRYMLSCHSCGECFSLVFQFHSDMTVWIVKYTTQRSRKQRLTFNESSKKEKVLTFRHVMPFKGGDLFLEQYESERNDGNQKKSFPTRSSLLQKRLKYLKSYKDFPHLDVSLLPSSAMQNLQHFNPQFSDAKSLESSKFHVQ